MRTGRGYIRKKCGEDPLVLPSGAEDESFYSFVHSKTAFPFGRAVCEERLAYAAFSKVRSPTAVPSRSMALCMASPCALGSVLTTT